PRSSARRRSHHDGRPRRQRVLPRLISRAAGPSTSARSRSAITTRRASVNHRPRPKKGEACGIAADYGLMAKLRVVQPELEALPPGAPSIELPQTCPTAAVVGAAGSGLAPA